MFGVGLPRHAHYKYVNTKYFHVILVRMFQVCVVKLTPYPHIQMMPTVIQIIIQLNPEKVIFLPLKKARMIQMLNQQHSYSKSFDGPVNPCSKVSISSLIAFVTITGFLRTFSYAIHFCGDMWPANVKEIQVRHFHTWLKLS